ncbi:DNA primase [Methylobacter psychrophilus]|uniref:DNA primase n=1 Tax=Methylobacter psychrophilus TaxID=96941 RepID=UPI0021D4D8F7|nr:DNA primase [Methylobacter psychrophilus]
MSIDTLLSKLDKVKPIGNGKWLALCPAHPDKSPSLAIKQADNGKILIHCFAGCQVTDIVAAVGMELSDLMPENLTYQKGSRPPKFNKYELFDRLVFESVILSMGIRQLLAKEDLSTEDLSRVLLAENTINGIVREVRQ